MTATGPENFDRLLDRAGTWSAKWDKYQGRDILPFWVADMDFPVAPAITDALRVSFGSGSVMGLSVVGLGLLGRRLLAAWIIAGIEWAVVNNVDIINMSLSGRFFKSAAKGFHSLRIRCACRVRTVAAASALPSASIMSILFG